MEIKTRSIPGILGLDIGGTKTLMVLGSMEGKIIHRSEIPTPSKEPFERAFQILLGHIQKFQSDIVKKSNYQLQVISVSIGGPLDIERGVLINPPHFPLWHGAQFKKSLQEMFNLPVFFEHDGNAGALAEFYFGAGKGVSNLVFLTLGTGLGAGLILNKRLYRGSKDMAGEVGHIRISHDGPAEYDKPGSWEGLCSAAGLVRLALLRDPDHWSEDITAREVIDLAKEGDCKAKSLINEMGEWLGRGVATLVDLLNPEIVILGTLGVVLGEQLLDPTRRMVEQEALPLAAKNCRLLPAGLGDDLGAVSSLMAAIQAFRDGKWYPKWGEWTEEFSKQIIRQVLESGREIRAIVVDEMIDAIDEIGSYFLETLSRGRKIWMFGNGGSAALAQHFAGEITGHFRTNRGPLPALALNSDGALLSCIANDFGFDEIFSRQISALASPKDLVLGITTSGASQNVLNGLKAAREVGARTIALTGADGLGEKIADHVLAVPSRITARVQEEHNAIIHAWCELIDGKFSEWERP